MNACMGGGKKYYATASWFYNVKKMSDLHTPGPSDAWLLMDQHPDSLDDGAFYYSNDRAAEPNFIELPGSNHGGASGISFADGHSELYKLRMRAVPVAYVDQTVVNRKYANAADQTWFDAHTPQN